MNDGYPLRASVRSINTLWEPPEMNTLPSLGYRPFQRIHPLSLLASVSSRQASGRLQVVSEATVWSLYLEQGQLVYATNLVDPFERLDRHLQQLGRQVESIVSAVRVQVRLLFEQSVRSQTSVDPDYRAICWLVEQQYLTPAQAASLIDGLVKEVIEGFLSVKAGTHETAERSALESYPEFCRMDLRSLVEFCQAQLRSKSPQSQPMTMSAPGVMAGANNGQRLGQPVMPGAASVAGNAGSRSVGSSSRGTSAIDSPPAAGLKPKSLGKEHYTIVCIDDSPTVLQAINSFLDDSAFTVVMINDPVKALMQVVRSKPDLILLDVGMPNLDGYELCRLLRRHPTFKSTPIIMVTGHTGFLDRAKAKLVGSSGYLTKPFTQSDLLKIVFQHLHN
jgi:two-component system, chemotaxis family, response regulator PixG